MAFTTGQAKTKINFCLETTPQKLAVVFLTEEKPFQNKIIWQAKTKMNPYVYSKRKKAAVEPQMPGSTGAMAVSLVKSVFSSSISSAVAFAIVILAAGSVASMTAIASAEIGGGTDILPVAHMSMAKLSPQVLGDSTIVPAAAVINDSALESGVTIPTVKILAKSVGYDSTLGRWNYSIAYYSSSLSGSGSITIGSYVVSSGLTALSGKVDTGAILKPSMVYHVTFWVTDSSGMQSAAATAEIRTGKGKTSGDDSALVTPCQIPKLNQGTSTPPTVPPVVNGTSTSGSMFCLKTKDGKMICPRPPVCGQMGQGGDHMGGPTSTPPFSGGQPPQSPTGTPPTAPHFNK